MLSRAKPCDNVPIVGKSKLTLGVLAATLIALTAMTPSALARTRFRPRIGHAFGLIPAHGHQADPAAGAINIPVVYHGGAVMHDVHIHTIFWAAPGFKFDGPPSPGGFSYRGLIERFLVDVAHDSGSTGNVFSVLGQYPDGSGPGSYRVSYTPSTDSIGDGNPYPAGGSQCASPGGVAACVTDVQLQREIDRNIQAHDPGSSELHDVWFVFLPPDVDTCISLGACATNAYAGYHSLLNVGHGPVIYSVIPDPLIEFTPPQGADPQGNPEAETTLDTVAHEAVEAATNPVGVGWMDPNGFEVGDKCETGPQAGTPLGFAGNGSPYNQRIAGHEYLLQTMWSNADSGCEQRSSSTSSALPLPVVSLAQWSPVVTGTSSIARKGVQVLVVVARAGVVVAGGVTSTRADGSWRLALHSLGTYGPAGVGDDREEVLVHYGSQGPRPELIQTGNGGDPFQQSGWTGWFDLDHGAAVRSRSVLLGPCSQTGVLTLSVAGPPLASPLDLCGSDNTATVPTPRLGPASRLRLSSSDNRASTAAAPNGALVKLSVALGEPGGVDRLGNAQVPFTTSGQPSCTADLRLQSATCTGLVPHARYTLTRSRGRASVRSRARRGGSARFAPFRRHSGIRGGDTLTLRNSAGRALTRLHVAHLRVRLDGSSTVIAGGRCEPGEFYGTAVSGPPLGPAIGAQGVAGTGTICPLNARAAGLQTANILQTDDRSGGQTRTEVPAIIGTAPVQNATLYGSFVALAQAGLPGPHSTTIGVQAPITVSIVRVGSTHVVFHAGNVGTASGATVSGLDRGTYTATWVLRDANGDTRTIHTRFIQAG
jgi:hypothetical protein